MMKITDHGRPKILRKKRAAYATAAAVAGLLLTLAVIYAPSYAPAAGQGKPAAREAAAATGPVVLANLEDESIGESSGVAASRRSPGLFWTHNDSGDGPFLYAFDRRGRRRGVWRVEGAKAIDWEDMAAGPAAGRGGESYLYAGDIGDNSARRAEIVVYRVKEPVIKTSDARSSRRDPLRTERAEALRLKYPDGKYDAETLMVHPRTGDLYLVTKSMRAASRVYRARAPLMSSSAAPHRLEFVGELRLPGLFAGLATGGDISPDGRRVVICDYLSAYEFSLPSAHTPFEQIWKQAPRAISLGPRQQGEAVCYRLDGRAVIATSEKTPTPLIEFVLPHR